MEITDGNLGSSNCIDCNVNYFIRTKDQKNVCGLLCFVEDTKNYFIVVSYCLYTIVYRALCWKCQCHCQREKLQLHTKIYKTQRNGLFAHSELVLLTLFADDDKLVRIDACNKIQQIVMNNDNDIRRFKPPALKLTAATLQDLYETNNTKTMPPILQKYKLFDLRGVGWEWTNYISIPVPFSKCRAYD